MPKRWPVFGRAVASATIATALAVEGMWAGAAPPGGGDTQARAPAPAAVTRRVVGVYDNYFQPRRVRIPEGARIRWVNRGEVPHTTTGRAWDVVLEPGESYTRRFRRAGTYRYYCRFHPGQTGRIIVVG